MNKNKYIVLLVFMVFTFSSAHLKADPPGLSAKWLDKGTLEILFDGPSNLEFDEAKLKFFLVDQSAPPTTASEEIDPLLVYYLSYNERENLNGGLPIQIQVKLDAPSTIDHKIEMLVYDQSSQLEYEDWAIILEKDIIGETSHIINTVKSTQYLEEVDANEQNKSLKQKTQSITYADGLGKPLQKIDLAVTPLGNDMVIPIHQDALGSVTQSFLPYPDNFSLNTSSNKYYTGNDNYDDAKYYRVGAPMESYQYYKERFNEGSYPYAELVSEKSPRLKRIKENGTGTSWRIKNDEDHSIRFFERPNFSNEVLYWEINSQDEAVANEYYFANQLKTIATTNEEGHTTFEYYDKRDLLVKKSIIYNKGSYTASKPSKIKDSFKSKSKINLQKIDNPSNTNNDSGKMSQDKGKLNGNNLNKGVNFSDKDSHGSNLKNSPRGGETNSGLYNSTSETHSSNAQPLSVFDYNTKPGLDDPNTKMPGLLDDPTLNDNIEPINPENVFIPSNGEEIATYYVYDKYGNLRFIIPPAAIKEMSIDNQFLVNDYILNKWCIKYSYNGLSQLIRKQKPGVKPEEIICDPLGRVVLSRNGELKNRDFWLFTKYDHLDRPIYTGLFKIVNKTLSQITRDVEIFYENGGAYYEERSNSNLACFHGYSNQSYPILGSGIGAAPSAKNYALLSITYYDDYDFNRNNNQEEIEQYADLGDSEYGNIKKNRLSGITTMNKIRILDNDVFLLNGDHQDVIMNCMAQQWEETVYFYDNIYSNVVQTYKTNYWGGYNRSYSLIDFSGKVLKHKHVHIQGENIEPIAIEKIFDYDHINRLTSIHQKINDGTSVQTVAFEYNELGQLVEENIHEISEDDYAQSVDYKYNIRGWTTHINPIQKEKGYQDLFRMRMHYQNNGSYSNHSGKLSGISWNYFDPVHTKQASPYKGPRKKISDNTSATDISLAKVITPAMKNINLLASNSYSHYNYKYDNLGQLSTAKYLQKSTSKIDNTCYYLYDLNGNIASLNRKGLLDPTSDKEEYGFVDKLDYYYEGNRLLAVNDQIADSENRGYDFKDNGSNNIPDILNPYTNEYSYDGNGNLVSDKNKGIQSIEYNLLNLPSKITFGRDKHIQFIWNAAGNKLSKIVTRPTSTPNEVTQTDHSYIDGFVYKDGELQFFSMDKGRVTPNSKNGKFNLEYQYKDHLGNSRLAYKYDRDLKDENKLQVLQKNGYYPYGMSLPAQSFSSSHSSKDKFTFNGKELEDDLELDWYHYGARYYDPQIARWTTQDPVNEFYSPYAYVGNDPVNYVDPDGESSENTQDYTRDLENFKKQLAEINSRDDIDKKVKEGLTENLIKDFLHAVVGEDFNPTMNPFSVAQGVVIGEALNYIAQNDKDLSDKMGNALDAIVLIGDAGNLLLSTVIAEDALIAGSSAAGAGLAAGSLLIGWFMYGLSEIGKASEASPEKVMELCRANPDCVKKVISGRYHLKHKLVEMKGLKFDGVETIPYRYIYVKGLRFDNPDCKGDCYNN